MHRTDDVCAPRARPRFSDVNLLAYLATFGGGVVSFLSPCVLPLVPGYLSIVTGLDLADAAGRLRGTRAESSSRPRGSSPASARCSCARLSATWFGPAPRDHQDRSRACRARCCSRWRCSCSVPCFSHAPWLYQEKRFHPQLGRFGAAAPRWRRRVRLRVVAVHRADPRLDPRHRREPHRVWAGGTLLVVVLAGPRAAVPVERTCSGGSSGALSWVKRHFALIVGGLGRRDRDVRCC